VKTLSKVNTEIRTFHIQLHRELLGGAHRVLRLAGVQSGIAPSDGTQLQSFLWERGQEGAGVGSPGNLIQLQHFCYTPDKYPARESEAGAGAIWEQHKQVG